MLIFCKKVMSSANRNNSAFSAKFVFAAFFFAMLASCNNALIFEVNTPLKQEQWSYDEPVSFEVEIADTALRYDISISLRHSFHFEWRNVWVNIETEFPDGKKLSKRINLLLCEADGVWFGKCANDNCDIKIPIQENAIFPSLGIYKFRIAQDMRVNPLPNIRSVGFCVEKTPKSSTP